MPLSLQPRTLRTWMAVFAATVAAALPAGAAGRVYVVDAQAPQSADSNDGTEARPLKTINAAAQLAGPGDTVLVRAGVYRERVAPARGGEDGSPVVYQAAPGARVEIKGSEAVADWKPHPEHADVVTTSLDALIPAGQTNPYLTGVSIAATPEKITARPAAKPEGSLIKTLGQVFFDGEPVIQAATVADVRATPNTWIVSPDGRQIWARFRTPQTELGRHLIEVTVRDRIFAPRRRGLSHVQVRGFVFEHCANQGPFPQGGAVSPRSGSRWLFEGNTIRLARTIGLDVGSETWDAATLATDTHPDDRKRIEGGGHVVEGNVISDNGLAGIAGWHHNGVVIRGNVVERNHTGDFTQGVDAKWEEWGGIKLHGKGALIEGNLVRDNEAFGIWLDNDVSGSRVTRNLVLNNRMAGIFIELSEGICLVDTNVIVGTRARGSFYDGMGVYAHDACDVTVAHNLIMENAGAGVVMRTVSDRTFDVYKDGKRVRHEPVASSRNRVLNNIIWGNGKEAVSLPFDNRRGTGNVSDYNLLFGAPDYQQGNRPHRQLFSVNIFKGTRSADEAIEELKTKLAAASIPAGEWPNPAFWRWHPVLGLAQWQAFTGQDRNSREPWQGAKILLRARDLTMRAELSPAARRMNCPPVAGVDADYFGKPLPAGRIAPGPFQSLAEAGEERVLFPVTPRSAARPFVPSLSNP